MAGTLKSDFRTGLVNSLGTFIGLSILSWGWGEYQALIHPPKGHHGSAAMLVPVVVPFWVMALAVAVFVAFAFFPSVHRWFYRDENEAGAVTSGTEILALKKERDALRLEFESAVPKQVFDAMKAGREFAERTRGEAMNESAAVHKKWAMVVHNIVSYYRIVDLLPSLAEVLKKMEARLPSESYSRGDPTVDFMRMQDANEKDFRTIRPQIIKVMRELQVNHGLYNEALSDTKIGSIISDPKQVSDMMAGFEALAYTLRNIIAESAIEACPEASYALQHAKNNDTNG